MLRPESLEGTDEEDPVSALEWDPLSTDYLLGETQYKQHHQYVVTWSDLNNQHLTRFIHVTHSVTGY